MSKRGAPGSLRPARKRRRQVSGRAWRFPAPAPSWGSHTALPARCPTPPHFTAGDALERLSNLGTLTQRGLCAVRHHRASPWAGACRLQCSPGDLLSPGRRRALPAPPIWPSSTTPTCSARSSAPTLRTSGLSEGPSAPCPRTSRAFSLVRQAATAHCGLRVASEHLEKRVQEGGHLPPRQA